jgi:hypothetical protein
VHFCIGVQFCTVQPWRHLLVEARRRDGLAEVTRRPRRVGIRRETSAVKIPTVMVACIGVHFCSAQRGRAKRLTTWARAWSGRIGGHWPARRLKRRAAPDFPVDLCRYPFLVCCAGVAQLVGCSGRAAAQIKLRLGRGRNL